MGSESKPGLVRSFSTQRACGYNSERGRERNGRAGVGLAAFAGPFLYPRCRKRSRKEAKRPE